MSQDSARSKNQNIQSEDGCSFNTDWWRSEDWKGTLKHLPIPVEDEPPGLPTSNQLDYSN